jgi:putative nucleotidyltransferase with HDIG domain
MMDWQRLILNLECIDSLATLPSVYAQVCRLLEDPETSVTEIAEEVSRDPAISLRLLKVVNSPFFALSRKIRTVRDAVTLLGFEATRNVVLMVSVMKILSRHRPRGDFQPQLLWRHALFVGAVAKWLAEKLRVDPGDAFTGGVLHDVGKLVLLQFFPAEFDQVRKLAAENDMAFRLAEEEVYSGSHCDLGSYLADKWNLPLPLVEAIDRHHEPMEAAHLTRLVAAVHFADVICHQCGWGDGTGAAPPSYDRELLVRLELREDDVERWVPAIREAMDGVNAPLGVAA